VKQERLDFLADNPFYTKRFAYFVGRRCRQRRSRMLRRNWRLIGTPSGRKDGADRTETEPRYWAKITHSIPRRGLIEFGRALRSNSCVVMSDVRLKCNLDGRIMTAPALSVVTPCYNEEEVLAEFYRRASTACLTSVASSALLRTDPMGEWQCGSRMG
jgi:hypothetical protein